MRPARRPTAGATQEAVRRHNLATALSLVHLRGALSRTELTAAMGLNRSTIGALTADLIGAGLVVEEVPEVPAGGAGRPSLVVTPREDVVVVAVHLAVDSVVVARVGLGGRVVRRTTFSHDPRDGAEAVLHALLGAVTRMLDDDPAARCVGVGVAVCGLVRRTDGVVRVAPNLGWSDVPLGDELRAATGRAVPVAVANEADLGALAEHQRGAAVDVDDVVFVFGDVGIGGGVIAGGRPMSGLGGYAGEIGHVRVNPAGRACRCGRVGCWETEASIDSMLQRAGRRPPGTDAAVLRLLADAESGDRRAATAVAHCTEWLAVGLGQLVTIFNPSTVIVGGPLGLVLAARHGQVLERVRRESLAPPFEGVRVTVPALGADSALLGAAELAFAPLLGDPAGLLEALSPGVRATPVPTVVRRTPTGDVGATP